MYVYMNVFTCIHPVSTAYTHTSRTSRKQVESVFVYVCMHTHKHTHAPPTHIHTHAQTPPARVDSKKMNLSLSSFMKLSIISSRISPGS